MRRDYASRKKLAFVIGNDFGFSRMSRRTAKIQARSLFYIATARRRCGHSEPQAECWIPRSRSGATPWTHGSGTSKARLLLTHSPPLNQCPPINTKLPGLARHILRYLREHPEAQDTVEGIMVWWVSERAIKHWLPQVRRSLAALVARGYLEKCKTVDGHIFYRINTSRPTRRDSSRQ
jgi:hypothetical protein